MRHKGFAPLILIILIAIAVLILIITVRQKPDSLSDDLVDNSTLSPSSSPEVNDKSYHNNKWKFQIELPDSWDGYKVSEHDWTGKQGRDYSADVCFFFERENSIPACILQISLFSREEWKIVPPNQFQLELGEKDGFIYTASKHDPGCVQLDTFQCDRSKEIDQIVKTFKFIE